MAVCLATVLYDFQGTEESELNLTKGEVLKVLTKYDNGWWVGETSNGHTGVFPGSYVKEEMPPEEAAPAPPVPSQPNSTASVVPLYWVTTNRDFTPTHAMQLAYKKGDRILLLERFHTGWNKGKIGETIGLFNEKNVDGMPHPDAPLYGPEPVESAQRDQKPSASASASSPPSAIASVDTGNDSSEPKRGVALFDYQATKPEELSFTRGCVIDVLQTGETWWKGVLVATNTTGIFPADLVSLEGLREKKVEFKALAKFPFVAQAPEELSFPENAVIDVLEVSDENGWWKGIFQGRFGHFPGSYVEKIDAKPSSAATKYSAVFPFEGNTEAGELSFVVGDIIDLIEPLEDGWCRGSLRGVVGFFPASYTEKLETPETQEAPLDNIAVDARHAEEELLLQQQKQRENEAEQERQREQERHRQAEQEREEQERIAEAKRVAAEEAARLQAEEEQRAEEARLEAERAAENARLEAQRAEEARLAAEAAEAEARRVAAEEQERLAAVQRAAEAERIRVEEAERAAERAAEAERVEQAERAAEAHRRAEAERVSAEEERLRALVEAKQSSPVIELDTVEALISQKLVGVTSTIQLLTTELGEAKEEARLLKHANEKLRDDFHKSVEESRSLASKLKSTEEALERQNQITGRLNQELAALRSEVSAQPPIADVKEQIASSLRSEIEKSAAPLSDIQTRLTKLEQAPPPQALPQPPARPLPTPSSEPGAATTGVATRQLPPRPISARGAALATRGARPLPAQPPSSMRPVPARPGAASTSMSSLPLTGGSDAPSLEELHAKIKSMSEQLFDLHGQVTTQNTTIKRLQDQIQADSNELSKNPVFAKMQRRAD